MPNLIIIEGEPIGTPVSLGSVGIAPTTFISGTLTTVAAISAGDLVVVGVHNNSTNAITVSSVSDGTNTYTKATSQIASVNTGGELWYCANAAAVGPGAVITVTFSGSSGASSGYTICAAKVAGVIAILPLDKTSGTTGLGISSLSTTTATLSQANEIVFGVSYSNANPAYNGASGFTAINTGATSGGNGATWLDYQKVSATTAVTFGPAWGASAPRLGAMQATFKGF